LLRRQHDRRRIHNEQHQINAAFGHLNWESV
jgi:hypothetical protein